MEEKEQFWSDVFVCIIGQKERKVEIEKNKRKKEE
jgi:hypothetical protein